nr:MAG TPA: hypothetical protein [Caudoviricetes sp.]
MILRSCRFGSSFFLHEILYCIGIKVYFKFRSDIYDNR